MNIIMKTAILAQVERLVPRFETGSSQNVRVQVFRTADRMQSRRNRKRTIRMLWHSKCTRACLACPFVSSHAYLKRLNTQLR